MIKDHSISFILITFALASCVSTVPIYNVYDAQVKTVTGEKATLIQVETAIKRAGISHGWKMQNNDDGYILGILNIRTHTALIGITYDEYSYSIIFKSSKNLDYDGENIHPNYNNWIKYLNQSIQYELLSYRL